MAIKLEGLKCFGRLSLVVAHSIVTAGWSVIRCAGVITAAGTASHSTCGTTDEGSGCGTFPPAHSTANRGSGDATAAAATDNRAWTWRDTGGELTNDENG
jgi:hypothetical protein